MQKIRQSQNDVMINFDSCAMCGIVGDLICCDGCPQAFHIRCLSASLRNRQRLCEDKWYCSQCEPHILGLAEAAQAERYRYIKMSDVRCLSISEVYSSPSCEPQLNLILQHLDWFLAPDQVKAIAQLFQMCPTFKNEKMKKNGMNNQLDSSLNINSSCDATNDRFTPSIERGICFNTIVRRIRSIVSTELFDEVYNTIKDRHVVIAVGLGRSKYYGPQSCPRCTVPRYSRYYCCRCGYLFSVKDELLNWTRAALGVVRQQKEEKTGYRL